MKMLLLLSILLILGACEKSFNISIPDYSNKPVLNLLMNKDSVMIARVALSTRLGDRKDTNELKDAVVNLFENGIFKERLSPYILSGRVYYRSKSVAKTGVTYRISAAVPGYEEVSGSDIVPDTVDPGPIRMTVSRIDQWRNRAVINIQLHDDPAVQNYYRIRLYQVLNWVGANGDTVRLKLPQYFESGEMGLPLLEDDTHPEFYTTDALFNGRNLVVTLKADVQDNLKTMIVEVSSLTYHSYNYLNSAYQAQEKNEDGLSEKVIVYNNILNGFGIVGGVAQREYELSR